MRRFKSSSRLFFGPFSIHRFNLSDRGLSRALSCLRFSGRASFSQKELFAIKLFDGNLAGCWSYRKLLSGKTDFAQPFNRLSREGNLGNISSLELIFVDNSDSPRIVRVIAS